MAGTNSTKPPSYRLHKATGQAVVTLNRKDHYLGKHGTPESRLLYERLITQWMQFGGAVAVAPPDVSTEITVAELGAQYLRWATDYYRKDGVATSELVNVKRALRVLRECYAALPAKDFSPTRLQACRDRLITDGLARTNVNRYARIIVRIFRFGVERELVPAAKWQALTAVRALQKNRSSARETLPVTPVDDATIEATLPHLGEPYRTMVKLQLLLGCRPGELTGMTAQDIDRSGPIWLYRPSSHKGQHHNKTRVIPIGPKAQVLLRPLLPALAGQYVFRNAWGNRITRNCFGATLRRACEKAGIEPWSPNRLRHAAATKIGSQVSLDAAQVILGHSTVATTQVYAEKNLTAALEIAAKVG
jgi:integrase